MENITGKLKGRTASRHARHFRILYLSAGQRASSSCEGNIFFRLKHQLSSCQHSGRLTVRIWIRLIILSGRYFRSKCTRWR